MTTVIFTVPERLDLSNLLTFVSKKWSSNPVVSRPLQGPPSVRIDDYGFQGDFTFDADNSAGKVLVRHINETANKFGLPAINFFDFGVMTVWHAQDGDWQYSSTQLALPSDYDDGRRVKRIRFQAAERTKIG